MILKQKVSTFLKQNNAFDNMQKLLEKNNVSFPIILFDNADVSPPKKEKFKIFFHSLSFFMENETNCPDFYKTFLEVQQVICCFQRKETLPGNYNIEYYDFSINQTSTYIKMIELMHKKCLDQQNILILYDKELKENMKDSSKSI